ncbi:MAG: hypothetical protein KDD38_06655 [Bdellovibrionales bacterium]|nr:hypothetical protein [Bdellovibrionales bacterium]
METTHLISGFTHIKTALRIKTRTNKSMDKLGLWFTNLDGVFYAHDYEEHKVNIALAVQDKNVSILKVYLKAGSAGDRLVRHFFEEGVIQGISVEEIANNLYSSYGFLPFSRF